MDPYNFINFSNLALIEEQYQNFLKDRTSVDPLWHAFFDGVILATPDTSIEGSPELLNTYLLIQAYRSYGHRIAKCNPLEEMRSYTPEILDPKRYNLNNLTTTVPSFGLFKETKVSLEKLIRRLQEIYCGSIGFEYLGICQNKDEKILQELIENKEESLLTDSDKKLLYNALIKAESFELYLHTKYAGQKRFSLEGCESLIPLLEEILETSATLGAQDVVIGMAHRGRLNVLANILKKDYKEIFEEFSENYVPKNLFGSGDVKYHKGYKNTYLTPSNHLLQIILADNPSHLEAVDCVVEGIAKALQDKKGNPSSVLPLLIHGDASIAGQGVVYETLQMERLEGYATFGTIHIVINNQIGFTATPQETKSTLYCTDIGKTFNAPIIHVNAYDVLACAKAAKLAALIRNKTQSDVFIDLIGYRRWGHNEGDEPFYTQPKLYREIKQKPSILSHFKKVLIDQGFQESDLESMHQKFLDELKAEESKQIPVSPSTTPREKKKLKPLTLESIQTLAEKITTTPKGFTLHPKIEKLFKERFGMLADPSKKKIDWAFAELLSFATLLQEGISIRLSGEDCQRGTFSQRHAVVVDQNTEEKLFPLCNAQTSNSSFTVYNSHLSEYAVLGFEYGYSITADNTLVLWEAQFGDFANGAQIIIDQYLSSGKQKWGIDTNLTLLLPHGYEGQGPEHSSARIERFLTLAAQENMTLALPTSPSQHFHLLRRQATMDKPCVIFTPKGMLRHSENLSSVNELLNEEFQTLKVDAETIENATTLFLSVGKIFYDLKEEIKKREKTRTCQISIEQLYPFDKERLKTLMDSMPKVNKVLLIQDEPENMGALRALAPQISSLLKERGISFYTISRQESASPAAGSLYLHKKEQQALFDQVFNA